MLEKLEGHTWLATNEYLNASAPGIAYRHSRDVNDRVAGDNAGVVHLANYIAVSSAKIFGPQLIIVVKYLLLHRIQYVLVS